MHYPLLLGIGLLAPLAGFLLLLIFGHSFSRKLTSLIGCTTIFISFCAFVSILYTHMTNESPPTTEFVYKWFSLAGFNASIAFEIDHLSLLMTLIITGIGFLIHVYSVGYTDHEEDYSRYFACMNLFIFAMLILVLASDLLLLFVGWEGVGLASYLLIGYYYEKPSAAAAATKAFVVNRIGDAGLLIALLIAYSIFGTLDINTINQRAPEEFAIGSPWMVALTLFFLCGAIGKSAQLPLHVWLPDAMEGPTPVSALIHAATMVTAGVYLIVRLHPLFLLAPTTMQVVGVIGAVTSLFAACSAVAQTDLKRVLAYSTLSQLGLMFLACGAGAFYAAMFHLTTHAFVKALLFLSAGNVVHMMAGNTDMRKMGGLSKNFPWTNWLFLLGALALSGIPPLAIFFSKDLILEEEYLTGHTILFGMGLLVNVLTSFYMFRAWWLTFAGPTLAKPEVIEATHEAPAVMLGPVTFLGLLSIIGGFLGFSRSGISLLESFLSSDDPTLLQHAPHPFSFSPELWISIIASLVGLFAAWFTYSSISDRLTAPIQFLKKAFYLDELYDLVIRRPLKAIAGVIAFGTEPVLFDGSVNAVVRGSNAASQQLQKVQSGQIRSYLAWMLIGGGLLLTFLTF